MVTNRTAVVIVAVFAAIYGCGGSSPASPSAAAGPRTLYVSTTGSDRNNGAMNAPWLTIRHAVGQLRAGDTLYMRGGTYEGSENTIDSARGIVAKGTSWSNAVTIAGYPGETVTLEPPDNVHALRLSVGAPAYLIFQDFIIDAVNSTSGGAEPEGIYVSNGAHHNRFQRLEVRNVKSFGVVFSRNGGNSPFNQVLDSKVHRTGNGRGDARNGHGFYISTSDNLIEGNEVYDNEGYGLQFYDDAGPKDVTRNVIRRNNVHSNGRHGGTAYGIAVAWGDKNVVSSNVVFGNPGGVMVYTESSNAEVSGNRIYANTPLEGVFVQYATGTVITDNEIAGNGISVVDLGVGTRLTGNR